MCKLVVDETKVSEALGSAAEYRAAAPVKFSCVEQSKASHSIAWSLAEQGSRELVTSMPFTPRSTRLSVLPLPTVSIMLQLLQVQWLKSQVGNKHSWSSCVTELGFDRLSARVCTAVVKWDGGARLGRHPAKIEGRTSDAQQQRSNKSTMLY
jgi:hypothetical protein